MALGKFVKVELRHFWPDEARNFTPWLAKEENIQELSNTIGIDIEVEATEQFIGNFKADIVARDISNDQKIIIENQLEKSNHDHLGKIITYASGVGASTIIWICSAITEEHRQAINWLNEHTSDELRFFALEIELWKIDDSKPAPRFNVICRPNEWFKSTKKSTAVKELSETKSLQLEYWNYLRDYLNQQQSTLNLRTPRAQHWYSIAIGRSKFNISLTVNTVQKRLGCEIYLRGESAKAAFHLLKQQQAMIEQELAATLQWQELPDGQDSRITLYQAGDISARENWNESVTWFKHWSESFYTVFYQRIRDLRL